MVDPREAEFEAVQRQMRQDDIREERRAWSEFMAALDQAAEIAIDARLDRFGDGEGGVILYEWRAALERHLGHPLSLPPAPSRTPKRRELAPAKCLAVFAADDYRCVHCGTREELTVDHIIPVSKGGGDERENLQTLCKRCNSSKGTKVD